MFQIEHELKSQCKNFHLLVLIIMVSYQCHCRKGHLANSFDQENSGMMGETDSLDDWILVVKHVTARDSGSYECQVNFIILIKFSLYHY